MIGRSGIGEEIFSDKLEISSNHALISYEDEKWMISDAGSKNGTYLIIKCKLKKDQKIELNDKVISIFLSDMELKAEITSLHDE